jgi:hypothetical protein
MPATNKNLGAIAGTFAYCSRVRKVLFVSIAGQRGGAEMNDRPILPASRARALFRGSVGAVFGLWLLLIVMFVAIYLLLRPGGDDTPPPANASGAHTWSEPVLVTFAPMVWVVLVVFFVAVTKRFNTANSAGLQALAEGDFARAESEFGALVKRFRWLGTLGGVARFNLGLARLFVGKLDDAIERFGAIETRASIATMNLRPSTACHLAIAYALRGQLDVARTWLAEAEKRVEKSPQRSALTGLVAFGQAIIEIREGRDQEVLRWLEPRWRGLEGGLTGGTMRSFTVLRAFATARAGGEREVGAAERILHALDPIRPGEFAMLEAGWPEMQRFLRA